MFVSLDETNQKIKKLCDGELNCVSVSIFYDIVYRQEKLKVVSDALSRVYCAATTVNALNSIHAGLSHPGIIGLYHFIRQKNLPYFLDDLIKMTIVHAQFVVRLSQSFLKRLLLI